MTLDGKMPGLVGIIEDMEGVIKGGVKKDILGGG